MNCRFCQEPLTRTFVDLGRMPLANSYLTHDQLGGNEPRHPLHVMVCDGCLLVQLDYTTPPEDIFRDYDYFSSTSPSWVENAREKCAHMVRRLRLGPDSLVVEVGSNDGYLLRHFADKGIKVLGIDPALGCAEEANRNGVPTVPEFFGRELADELVEEGYRADVVTGTNVLAHVPDINDFVNGLMWMIKPTGVVVMEFPHLANLIDQCQFDTVYHEHFFYYSFLAVRRILEKHGLNVFDVEELPTHGGSLRLYAQRRYFGKRPVSDRVWDMRCKENQAGLDKIEGYEGFAERVITVKTDLMEFLIRMMAEGKRVAAYGAPAKGSTLLNACGINPGLIEFTVDDSPHKQGKHMPGSHVPIVPREHLLEAKPDYVLILPWNLQEPIRVRNPEVGAWGGKWVVPIPHLKIMGE